MTLYEVLEEAGMSKEEVSKATARFAGNERLYQKFLQKFLGDKNFICLDKAVKDKNYKNAEIYAHTLKGVAANLGFNVLAGDSGKVVEHIRNGQYDKIDIDFEQCEAEYKKIIGCLQKLN